MNSFGPEAPLLLDVDRLRVADDLLRRVSEGRDCWLAGPPGSGKTSVVASVRHRWAKMGHPVLWAGTGQTALAVVVHEFMVQYTALSQNEALQPLAERGATHDRLWSLLAGVEQRAQASKRLWLIVWDDWDRQVGGSENLHLRKSLRAMWQQQPGTVHLTVGRDVEPYWAHREEPFYRYGDYVRLAPPRSCRTSHHRS